MNISPGYLLIAALAVWRLTHLLSNEDGPFDMLARFRRLLGRSVFGRLMDCFYCLSLWVAAPFAYGMVNTWWERLVLWLALSGGGILLERATAQPSPPTAVWRETPLPKSGEKDE